MKKMTFSERVLRAYAAVMKKLFPTWCVKHKTLKLKHYSGTWGTTHNYAGELFLPGKEAELKAIEKLKFDAEALNKRYWSMETKIELLEQGNFAMLSRIKTEGELMTVVRTGAIDKIIEAMRYYTPSRKYLLDFIRSMPDHQLFLIIKAVPSAFDSLQAWEVLGVDEKEPYNGKDNWAIARNFVEAKPAWAPKFIKEIAKLETGKLNDEVLLTLEKSVQTAMENKVDISGYVEYLMLYHPVTYAYFVRYYAASNYDAKALAPYVKVLLPKFIRKLSARGILDFVGDDAPSMWSVDKAPLSDDKEAAVWLYLALMQGLSLDVIISNLNMLRKHIYGKAWKFMKDFLISRVKKVSDIEGLLSFFADDEAAKKELHGKLLEAMGDNDPGVLKNFYPFTGWKEEQAEEAVRLMARGKCLPTDLSELSDKLREAAVEELEIQSELNVIRYGSSNEREALMEQPLHPRAEVVLFTSDGSIASNYGTVYVNNFEMDETTFAVIVNVDRDSKNCGLSSQLKKLIVQYAQKWGLTPQNYRDLMQSPYYSGLAPLVKKYVKEQ